MNGMDVLETLDHAGVIERMEQIVAMWKRKAKAEPDSSAAATLGAAEELLEDARLSSLEVARLWCRSLCANYLGTHRTLELSPALVD